MEFPASATLEDRIRFVLKGYEPAVEFFLLMRDVLHFWDDLIDRDKPISPVYINTAMFKALVVLPSNSFYRQFHDQLQPVLVNAIANWQAANCFEQNGDRARLELAFVIRSDYANLLIQSAYLVGGYEWMCRVTPHIRSMWTQENFAAYLSSLQREIAARRGATRELLRAWYEQETQEYLDSGLTVFNAAMLGETEEEHVDRLLSMINPPKGAVVIDMGCGVGGVSRLMAAKDPTAKFFGVTNVQAQVDKMIELGGVTPVPCDYHSVPLADGIADVVMFNESIGYGDLPVLMRESMRLLKPGGVVAIKDGVSPTGRDEWSPKWLWTTFAKGRIDNEAKLAGFEILASHETEYSMERYQEFVRNNPVMRDRYGEVTNLAAGKPVPSWFWLLKKPGG